MTLQERLDRAIRTAEANYQKALEAARNTQTSNRMTLPAEHHPRVEHAHGALNALADLRTELIADGVIR